MICHVSWTAGRDPVAHRAQRFVPALVGVDEAGTGALVKAAGFGFDHGVTLALIRKIRMFFWIGIGLVFLAMARKGSGKEG